MKLHIPLLFILLSLTSFSFGKDIPLGTPAATTEIRKVENYFNNLKTLQANFHQSDSRGVRSLGTIYIKRPDKLRFEYLSSPFYLLLSNNNSFSFIDRELREVSRVSLSDIPLGFLFVGDVALRGENHRLDRIEVDSQIMVMTFELFVGDVHQAELIFSLGNFGLIGWRLFMGDGNWVEVSLNTIARGVKLSDDLFRWNNRWE